MKKLLPSIFCIFLASFFLASCGKANGKVNILDKRGLERTNLDEWGRKDYPRLGISIEMPKDIHALNMIYGNNNDPAYGYSNFMFSMHPQYYGYVEPHYVVSFYVYVLSSQHYERFRNQKGPLGTIGSPLYDTSFFSELKGFHPDGMPKDQYCYRRDFQDEKTGDVVLATAVYWETIDPDPQHKEQDIAAIRRILNSIQFIPKEQK